MNRATTRVLAMAAAVGSAASLLTGCGLDTNYKLPFGVTPGSIQPVPELSGVSVRVGSKPFTENILLAYMAQIALTAAGADTTDMTNIQGSNANRQALLTGDIDLTWEYTGTSWISYNGKTEPIPDEREQYEAVVELDRQIGIAWLDYSPVNNTYAFATKRDFAERHKLETLSDMAAFLKQHPDNDFCVEAEFISRQDGLPGVEQRYGFDVPTANQKTFSVGTIYSAVDAETCEFGEVFTTDARILTLDLAVLTDDKKFFPQYNAAATVRTGFLERYPQLRQVIEPFTKKLTNETIQQLSVEVDDVGTDPAEVARDWMVREGFIGGTDQNA